LGIREFEEEIVDFYKKRLRELAGYTVVKSVPIRYVQSLKQTQRTIYYLVFGSNNEKAAKSIMDYVMDDEKLKRYLNKYIKTLEHWGVQEQKIKSREQLNFSDYK
jgi:hypothetical protein